MIQHYRRHTAAYCEIVIDQVKGKYSLVDVVGE